MGKVVYILVLLTVFLVHLQEQDDNIFIANTREEDDIIEVCDNIEYRVVTLLPELESEDEVCVEDIDYSEEE